MRKVSIFLLLFISSGLLTTPLRGQLIESFSDGDFTSNPIWEGETSKWQIITNLAVFDVDWRTGVFTGCLVALSSTAIVMKLLVSGGDMATDEGQAALGILIFQDLAVVAMVLLVPMLAGTGGSGADIAVALGKAVGIVALVLVAARRVMPPILEAVARTCSQEIFLLTVVGICLGTAYLTSLAGVSLSLGAFLAGLVVSESRFSQLAFGEILPLQILFSATFFVSVGLLLDVGFLIANPLVVLGVIGAVLVIKTASAGVGLLTMGYPLGPAVCSALFLAQIGEFSFVLERTGREIGLFPAGVQEGGPETFIAATVALMIASPLMYRLGGRMGHHVAMGAKAKVTAAPKSQEEPTDLRDHVIIAGFGDVGRGLAQLLDERRAPYLVVTLSPEGAREAERGGLRVLRGNYARRHELQLAGIRAARLFVVADDDMETTRRVVAAARALNPDVQIIARTHRTGGVSELREAGASVVVSEEREGLIRLLGRVLEAGGADADEVRREEERLRSWSGTGSLAKAHWLERTSDPMRTLGDSSSHALVMGSVLATLLFATPACEAPMDKPEETTAAAAAVAIPAAAPPAMATGDDTHSFARPFESRVTHMNIDWTVDFDRHVLDVLDGAVRICSAGKIGAVFLRRHVFHTLETLCFLHVLVSFLESTCLFQRHRQIVVCFGVVALQFNGPTIVANRFF